MALEALDIDGALETAEKIENPYYKTSALRRIAEAQVKASKTTLLCGSRNGLQRPHLMSGIWRALGT